MQTYTNDSKTGGSRQSSYSTQCYHITRIRKPSSRKGSKDISHHSRFRQEGQSKDYAEHTQGVD